MDSPTQASALPRPSYLDLGQDERPGTGFGRESLSWRRLQPRPPATALGEGVAECESDHPSVGASHYEIKAKPIELHGSSVEECASLLARGGNTVCVGVGITQLIQEGVGLLPCVMGKGYTQDRGSHGTSVPGPHDCASRNVRLRA